MRNYFIVGFFALSLCVMAQTSPNNASCADPIREKVYVDYFYGAEDVKLGDRSAIRNNVIMGMNRTNRVVLVDIESEPTLKIDKSLKDNVGETSVTADNVLAGVKEMGGKYVMTGTVTNIISERKTYTDSKGQTSVFFEGKIFFTLKVIDAATGNTKSSQSFERKATDSGSAESAVAAAIKSIVTESILGAADVPSTFMDIFVDEVFPVRGCIIQYGELDRKKNIKEVYVNMGSSVGVEKGQKFDVVVEKEIAGRVTQQAVAELVFKESQGDNITLCKVTKGGAAIKEAGNLDKPVVVVTKKGSNVGDKIGSFFR